MSNDATGHRELTIRELESWLPLLEMYSNNHSLLQGAAGEDSMSVRDVLEIVRSHILCRAVVDLCCKRRAAVSETAPTQICAPTGVPCAMESNGCLWPTCQAAPSAIAPSADEKRYRWLRRNGDKGIYVIQRWTQGDEHPPLALAQGGELDTIIDEHIAGTR